MITHVVLFQPRSDLTGDERQAVLHALASAVREIAAVRSCRIGRRIKHGLPGYEGAMTQDYEYAAILEFDHVDGLRAYLTHSAHESIGRSFTTAAAAALAYDYELIEVGDFLLP
jgi:hypothetical protein